MLKRLNCLIYSKYCCTFVLLKNLFNLIFIFMKTFSILNGINSYTINVNQSRRTFTLVYNQYDKHLHRWMRMCKDKSYPLTQCNFDLYLKAFCRFQVSYDEASNYYDFYQLMCIFPLFSTDFL